MLQLSLIELMGYKIVKSVARYRFLPALALVLVLAVSQIGGAVSAATPAKTAPVNQNVNSMKVSPLRTDITVKPGDAQTVEITITNLTNDTVVLQPIENDFVAGDEKGTPGIILDQGSYAPTHSLKRFMQPLQNVTLGPKAAGIVKLQIQVPITAQAGGYFGALRFAPPGKADQPVALTSSVASLVLLTVPGPTVEKLELTNFDVQQNGTTGGSFRDPKNLSLLVRFKNSGNLQLAPFGQVAVLKGKKVVYTYDFNQAEPKGVVLPDSARRWGIPLKNIGKFGKYTVSGTFGYGTGQSVEVKKTVWIVPTSYIIGAIGGFLLLVALIVGIRIFLKTYRRRVLNTSYRGR
jgi:hypothetical protein